MDTYQHCSNTTVRDDPFDLERLIFQRTDALCYLKNVRDAENADYLYTWFWRGIGCIRFQQCDELGIQKHLHVWHKDLVLPGIATGGGDIHEHPFTLVSDVLYGELMHTWYDVHNDLSFHHRYNYDVYDFGQSFERIGRCYATVNPVKLSALCSYSFTDNEFHSSTLNSDVAVTRCMKFNSRTGSSRILVACDRKPVLSTPFEPLPQATFKRVIDCAIAALESA